MKRIAWVLAVALSGCPSDKDAELKKLASAHDQPIAAPDAPKPVRPPEEVVPPVTAAKVDAYLEFQDQFTALLAAQVEAAKVKQAAAKADGSRDAYTKLEGELDAMSKTLSAKRLQMLSERGLTDLQGRNLNALIAQIATLKIRLDPAVEQLEKARRSLGMLPDAQRAEFAAQLDERQKQLDETGRLAHEREQLGDEAVDAMMKRRDAAIAGYQRQFAARSAFKLDPATPAPAAP